MNGLKKISVALVAVCWLFSAESFGQGLTRMQGEWVNFQNYEHATIRVTGGQFGYDVWVSNWGRARINYSTCGGGNIHINDGRSSCCFYATLTAGSSMAWSPMSGNSPRCPGLSGVYVRAAN